MIRFFLAILLSLMTWQIAEAQATNNLWQYPAEQGRILYEYEGNTEGQRELFFKAFGQEQALYTNLTRSSTFFAVKTVNPENVIEILKDNKHYHFNLDTKTGQVIDFPIHLLHKYFRIPDTIPYDKGLLNIEAELIGEEEVNGLLCKKWKYRSREFWVYQNLLIKMKSMGLNKNFMMTAVEIDFDELVPDQKFQFPEWYQGGQ